jgi:4,4'-diaponeurosporenoate glycosyltransferase
MDFIIIPAALVVGFFLLWKVPLLTVMPEVTDAVANIVASTSVVIPARNEENSLPALLQSLHHANTKVREIIVVDDDSRDRTVEIADNYGCKVLRNTVLPSGWAGKPWACWNGACAASGDYLLFFDADVFFTPGAVDTIVSAFLNGRGVLSIQPYHTMRRPYEYFSLYFNVIAMMSMRSFTPFGNRIKPLGLFGPCVFCAKEDYFAIDGHRSIRSTVLEDVALGKRFLEAGVPIRALAGRQAIRFRIYPSGLKAVVEGWGKNFASGAQNADPITLLLTILWVTGTISVLVGLLRSGFQGNWVLSCWYGIGYFFVVLQLFWMGRRIGNFGFLTALVYPAHAGFFVAVFFYSLYLKLFKKTVTWKDRSIKV